MGLASAWLWPKVSNRRFAQNAIQEAFWAAIFISAISAVFSAITFMKSAEDGDASGFFSSILFAGLAFGIFRRSRISATTAFILFTSETLYYWMTSGPKGALYRVLIALAFFHGVRGTISYHNFPPLPPNLPSIEQSFQAVRQTAQQDEQNPESSS
jgi:hypothetical protein